MSPATIMVVKTGTQLIDVHKGNYFEFKVRLTKNGKPFWVMTPEELAR